MRAAAAGAFVAVVAAVALPGCGGGKRPTPAPGHDAAVSAVPTAPPPPTPAASPTPSPTPSRIREVIRREMSTIGETFETATAALDPVEAAAEAIDAITWEDERSLGESAAAQVVEQGGGRVITDPPLIEYVERIAGAVSVRGSRKALRRDGTPRTTRRDVTVTILDDERINAHAIPGGFLFLTKGLLRNLGSESELAWVLGHEIAHLDFEHGLAALRIYMHQQALGDILWRLVNGPGARPREAWNQPSFRAWASVRMADIGMRFQGKEEERAADTLGLEYAVAAGYDADGAIRVLEMLSSGDAPRLNPFAVHDPPHARRLVLEDAVRAAKAKPGYSGIVAASPFTRGAIERLDALEGAGRHPGANRTD